jgi:hypothetical protein
MRNVPPTQSITTTLLKRIRAVLAIPLVAGALLGSASTAPAQANVYVNPAQTWGGYMNVFNSLADGGGYLWGSGWSATDLRAAFNADLLTLRPCTNVSNPSDTYWVKPDGSGNKIMEANWFVDTASLLGSNVVFSGNTVEYTLTTNYAVIAFIKVFPNDYSSVLQSATVPVTNANQFFSVNLLVDAPNAAHVQYGFATTGPNAPWTNSPDSDGYISIRTNAPAPLNTLVNPGFEDNLTGWTAYGNGGNTESQGNTYYNGGQAAGASNVLIYAGTRAQKVYGQFSGGQNYGGVYQDVPTGPGSVWAASAKSLTHVQDLLGAGNQFWIEVSFRDAGNAILATHFSQIIDETVTPNVWNYLVVTNIDGTSGTSLTAPAGTTKVRFQEVLMQPSFAGGSVYSDEMRLDNLTPSDPNITSLPVNQVKLVGETAQFTVAATGNSTIHYRWQTNGVDLVNGLKYAGVNSATLSISNLTKADQGTYSVVISNLAGMLDASASLTVKTPAEAANALDNSGFETGAFSPAWSAFNGTALKTTNDFYAFGTTPVSVYEGLYVGECHNGGEYNGVFQDIPAAPGDVFTADAWFLMATEEAIFGDTEGWLEVQFRAGGTPLALYKSAMIDAETPPDVWRNLQATNGFAGDFVTPIPNAYYLVAPPGTTSVRYQVTFHVIGGGSGFMYYDQMSLLRKLPVRLSTAVNGGNLVISWPTQGATSYQVVYKDNINDAWQPTGAPIVGDGSVKSMSFPTSGPGRFYSVKTL